MIFLKDSAEGRGIFVPDSPGDPLDRLRSEFKQLSRPAQRVHMREMITLNEATPVQPRAL
jgi:hypothetical protein